jgi:5-methylcytosine-specific restriction endonuclease McrA
MNAGICVFCEREDVKLTDHHLFPVTRHKNKKTKKETTREQRHTTVDACRSCHNQIHTLWTEKELEREWNTVEKLKSSPDMQKFIAWIQNKSHNKVPVPSKQNPLDN